MIINTRIEPQPGQLFGPGCLDENIGEVINFMIEGTDYVGHGVITATTVAEDGSHAWITCDVPGLASDTPDLGPVKVNAQEGPGYEGYAEEGV